MAALSVWPPYFSYIFCTFTRRILFTTNNGAARDWNGRHQHRLEHHTRGDAHHANMSRCVQSYWHRCIIYFLFICATVSTMSNLHLWIATHAIKRNTY